MKSKLNKESRNLLIGLLLGDGTISNNNVFKIAHSEKQKSYLEWKIKQLQNHGIRNNGIKTYIKKNGYNYNVNVQVGKADFPTKYYGDITLPAGTYDALKVQIGDAKGQNWWCVMFPPLCFVDVSTGIVPDNSKQELKQSLDDEEYALISKTDDNEISFKFKIVELFQNWRLGNK